MKKTVIELFAGVGGFRCAFNDVKLKNDKTYESKKWKFLWANQWEPESSKQDAFECYAKRFGTKEISNIDIFKVDKKLIPNHTLLVAGFPCQDYSVAQTLKSSKGIEGKKGVLWWAIAEILKTKKPPFVLLENVDRLLISPSKQRGRDFGIILRTFYDCGYDVQWRVVNSSDYGAPQKRRRIFIFAYNNKTKYFKRIFKFKPIDILNNHIIFNKPFPINKVNKSDFVESIDISSKTFNTIYDLSKKFHFSFAKSGICKKGTIYTFSPTPIKSNNSKKLGEILEKKANFSNFFLNEEQIQKIKKLKSSKKILRVSKTGHKYLYSEGAIPFPDFLNSPARTMLTSEGTINRSSHIIKISKNKFRFLTPLECERINEFPDNWTNTGATTRKRYFLMGNALVVSTVKLISLEISKIVDNE